MKHVSGWPPRGKPRSNNSPGPAGHFQGKIIRRVDLGVLLALDGLHPPSMGARVSFSGGKPKVTDGPFSEAKKVIGGYWMIQVKSKAEAIEWASRCPGSDNEVIEVRQVQEFSDFPADVRKAAARFPEMQAKFGQRRKS
jgi:hypothetical protein